MGKNKDNDGRQQGGLDHAPSQQSRKTRARQAEIASSGTSAAEAAGPRHDPEEIRAHDTTGKDRLFEGRQQHDEAEKNSEKTRLARDIDRHDHGSLDELSQQNRQASGKRKT